MINKQLLRKRFSDNAKTYDQYAKVQKKMANQLISSLPKSDDFIKILEIGCGSGYLTQLVCKAFPNASITAVDLAPGMIEIAKKRVFLERITFLCGDIEEMDFSHSFDIIISNATFQWLNYPQNVIKKMYGLLNQEGTLSFSTFGKETFQELHTSYKKAKEKFQIENASSPGQEFYSADDLVDLCESNLPPSYEVFVEKFYEREYFHDVHEFFTSVRKIGANNSNKANSLQRPSFIKELIKQYETSFRDEKGVKATYDCLFLTILKKGHQID
ncbi:malonyl-ACP O-methyltransferase BioC (plasmid) [Bacillus sp. F19]|nr:malonyl-ACP O-methyltransferase BioC [Bacillus sp. F19]